MAAYDYIYTSNDFGFTWTKLISIGTHLWKFVAITSTGQYQTATTAPGSGGVIWVSIDFGKTWKSVAINNGNVDWNCVAVSSSGEHQTIVGIEIWVSNASISANLGIFTDNVSCPSISSENGSFISLTASNAINAGDGGFNSLSTGSINVAGDGHIINLTTDTINSVNGNFNSLILSSTALETDTVGIPTSNVYSWSSNYAPLIINKNTSQISYAATTEGTNKTFVIDHPVNPSKYLVHACLEGPEAGVYYRGKSAITNDAYVVVDLPPYVDKFATNFTVQLTAIYNGISQNILESSLVESGKFTVYGKNGSFFWTVYGERGSIETEPFKLDVTLKGEGPYKWI